MRSLDESLLLWINQGWANPWLDLFLVWISQTKTFSFPLAGLILLAVAGQFGWRGVRLWFLMVVVVLLGDALGAYLKDLFSEPRPCFDLYESIRQPGRAESGPCSGGATRGMPSNHALNFFTAAFFLSIATRSWRWTGFLMSVAFLVMISRVYLGNHYPSQALVGALIGIAVGSLAGMIYREACPR